MLQPAQAIQVLHSCRKDTLLQQSCQRLGVEPWIYVQDVLTRLPTISVGQLGNLLPDHWQAARRAKMAILAEPATEPATASDE